MEVNDDIREIERIRNDNSLDIGIVEKVIGYFARNATRVMLWWFFKVVNKMVIIGKENVPDTGVLICPNHRSWIDTLIIPYSVINLTRPHVFLAPAKEELFSNPLFGPILRSTGAFPVKRSKTNVKYINRLAYFVNRYYVMIFPEGTRSTTGQILRGKPSVGAIISRSRPVVIPTLIINSENHPFSKSKKQRFGYTYYVVYDKPLDLDDLYDIKDLGERSRAIINKVVGRIKEMKFENRALYLNRDPDFDEYDKKISS